MRGVRGQREDGPATGTGSKRCYVSFFRFLSHSVSATLTLDVPLVLHNVRSNPEILISLSWIPTAVFLFLSCQVQRIPAYENCGCAHREEKMALSASLRAPLAQYAISDESW